MGDSIITEDELWADIDAAFYCPPRLPGDIDVKQMEARYGLSQNGAYNRMVIMTKTGQYEIVYVDDCGVRRKVLRRISCSHK